MLAIPDKPRPTRTAAAIQLEKVLLLVSRHLNFIFQHTRRPKHAHDVSFLGIAQADDDVGGILPQITIRSRNLKLLPIPSRENLNLGTDRGFVAAQPLEREPQPVILIPAFIAQKHGGTVILRDEKIGRAVAIVVTSDDGARIFQFDLVESNIGSNILEAVRPKIAEQA